ncbi:family 16 glycoside hydrolase [Flavobacterium daejeonense]|uniref:family 16 glycoside hydrolase n=1 Tax=Flavobacterium daejeonense TaxID=350893 RepID=UPI000479B13B|nr:family 16 glycoside hydrolase [Flavobacterium daejeonense]
MKIKIIVACFVLLTSLFSCKTIFSEDFNNNDNNWELYKDNKEFLVNIAEGKLHVEKFSLNRINNGCLWYKKEIKNFDTSKDFSIQFMAKIIKCEDVVNHIDFQWGDLNSNQKRLYQIDFGNSGLIRLNYFDKGWSYLFEKKLALNNITPSNQFSVQKKDRDKTVYYPVKANEFNKYEIIQKGNYCTIKINDIKVLSKKIKITAGNSIGIQQCLRSSWEIDKIVIKQ